MTTYTTRGNVRGGCGHKHRSLETAWKCLQRDRSGCQSQGGYSDRQVVRADGEPLAYWENARLYSLEDGLG
jgi:hypothetical protein